MLLHKYSASLALFYGSAYFWLLESQEKAVGLLWAAAQKV